MASTALQLENAVCYTKKVTSFPVCSITFELNLHDALVIRLPSQIAHTTLLVVHNFHTLGLCCILGARQSLSSHPNGSKVRHTRGGRASRSCKIQPLLTVWVQLPETWCLFLDTGVLVPAASSVSLHFKWQMCAFQVRTVPFRYVILRLFPYDILWYLAAMFAQTYGDSPRHKVLRGGLPAHHGGTRGPCCLPKTA